MDCSPKNKTYEISAVFAFGQNNEASYCVSSIRFFIVYEFRFVKLFTKIFQVA